MALVPLDASVSLLVLGSRALARRFEAAGCTVQHAHDVGDARRLLQSTLVRLLVVDAQPQPRGWTAVEFCGAVRALDPGPLLVISRDDEAERLALFDAGADDVVSTGCSHAELLTRAAVLLRRAPAPRREETLGELVLDLHAETACRAGRAITLTRYEFRLLRVLAQRRGTVVSRNELLALAKGSVDASFDRSIDVHISRLRAKLGLDRQRLRTVRGQGYLLAG